MSPALRSRSETEQCATSPEALLISAMLSTGSFTPATYHIADDDIEAWRKLWDFACEYQAHDGSAPPKSLVLAKFPDFDIIEGISPDWAAIKVHEQAASRALRTRSKIMLGALEDGDLQGAYAALDGLAKPKSHRKPAADIFDHSILEDDFEVSKIEVPYRALQMATKGGIGPGELWYLAARYNQGKSWELMGYAAKAAQAGCKVVVVSLEMPSKVVARRALLRLAGPEPSLVADLNSTDVMAQKKAMDIIAGRTPGSVQVLDPSNGQIHSTNAMTELCHEYNLVIVDHVGLMTSSDGRRAIDDWRAMALISNTLREITLATGTPILAAAQINREGENESNKPPKLSKMSQSDALGQDCDVGITMKRLSERVMVQYVEKVRNGPNALWYSRFDPERNRFEELTIEQHEHLLSADADRKH